LLFVIVVISSPLTYAEDTPESGSHKCP
jgi:hypothetical protein